MPSLEAVLVALVSPLADLASPASRHYGPGLLVALALAVLVWWREPRDRSLAVAGACSSLFHGPISGWTILGVDALGLVWNLAGGALRHSEIPLRYPRWLEHVLLSPAQHQIHHGDRPEQYHRNYGSTFALWDWALGSLVTSEHRAGVRYGLPPALKNHGDDALSAIVGPLREIVSMLVPRRLRGARVGALPPR